MAQTGYTPISIYNSATTTNVPTAGNLVAGELAINTADGKLFYKDSSGVVQTIATKASAALGGSTTGSGATVLQTSPTITTPLIDKITTSVANTSLGAGDASIMKNRIINGSMNISQYNGTSSVTPTANGTYVIDRWSARLTQASKYSTQQLSSSPPIGFNNYLGITSLSAYSVGSTDYFSIEQSIEGFNFQDLGFGTVNAKTFTLSFQVYSSLTGTFGGVFYNYSGTRCYPFSYTVSSANTWTTISITVAGDTTGTWNTGNAGACTVSFGLGAGSSVSGTAGSWGGTLYRSVTGATSVVGTNGATFYITGVQLEVGSSATGFEYVNYQTSLANCQRYFWKMSGNSGGNATFAAGQVYNSTDVRAVLTNPVPMRTNTTVSFTGSNFAYANAGSVKTLGTLNAADQTAQTALLYSGAGTTIAIQGQAAFWVITNIDSYISVSAEL